MAVAAPTGTAAQPAFFERQLPAALVLSSFFLLTLPVAAAAILSTDRRFLLVYVWLFSLTHFVLTFTIYLQSQNLRHFTATTRNLLLFVVIPLAILMGFYFAGFLNLRSRFPLIATSLAAIIRLTDFNHLNRQSFGVYQLFKARGGVRVPAAIKRTENGFFACLTALIWITYLSGGVSPLIDANKWRALGTGIATLSPALLPIGLLRGAAVAATASAAALGVISMVSLVRSWRTNRGTYRGLTEMLAYFGMQTAGALLAVISAPLYFATLAMHYVEYHVLMFPRCFHTSLDETKGIDHWFAVLRRYRAVFYLVLLVAAGMVLFVTQLQQNPTSALRANPIRYRAVVSIFDGLFVFHYFVEMLIWRFNDPFFRRTLTPLYFTLRPKAA